MDHVVAYELLAAELRPYLELPFDELRELVGERASRLMRGSNAVDYQLTVVVQLGKSDDEIRVTGFVGDATWGGPNDTLDEVYVVTRPKGPVPPSWAAR